LDEKNRGPLSVLHVSKRGRFRLGFQNLGETLLGVHLTRRASEVMAAYIEGGTLQCRPRACRSLADSFPYIGDDEQPR